MSHRIESLQNDWNDLGQLDPMWAILTEPERRGNWDRAAFFETGLVEIDALLETLRLLGISINGERALDFGCGIGRLSQALARHFGIVDGVDIAPSMIQLGDQLNPEPERIHYHVNASNDLALFDDGTFDMVLSLITLQHMPRALSAAYMAEFVRVLKPGGVCVFQIPWRRHNLVMRIMPRFLLNWLFMLRNPGVPRAQMFGTSPARVREIVESVGGHVSSQQQDERAGANWQSLLYVVTVDAELA